MKKTLIIVIILAIFLALISYIIYVFVSFPDYNTVVNTTEIHSVKFNESIYLKSKAWGGVSGNMVIVVSNSSNNEFKPDKSKEFVYNDANHLLYKFSNDTLNLYVDALAVTPIEFNSNIVVKQIIVPSSEYLDLLNSYKSKGINLFK